MRRRIMLVTTVVALCFVTLVGCGNNNTEENITIQETAQLIDNSSMPVEIDPFEYVTIEYEGDSYIGNIKNINNNATDDFLSGLTFTASKIGGLANGDTITVSIDNLSTATEQASAHNYVLSQTEKEYIVEGLPYYIYSLSEIPDDLMEEMKKSADEQMENYLENNILIIGNKEIENISSEYVGNLLRTVNSVSTSYQNHCYFVYKIHVETAIDEFEYYYYIEFYNLYKDKEGTVSLLVEYSGQVNGTTGECFEHGERTYEGFETIEDMNNFWYEKNDDNWTLDSNILE